MPVVSSTSPPDSQGVGSASSQMCTQRTGSSSAPAPASSRMSRPSSRSATVSTRSPDDLHALARLGQHTAEDLLDLRELLRSGDQRGRELDHRVAAVVGPADEPPPVQLAGQETAQQRLGL